MTTRTHQTNLLHIATHTLRHAGYEATPCTLEVIEVLDPVQCSNGARSWTEYTPVRVTLAQVHAFIRERS